MNKTMRPSAYPLITSDPYFSIWSMSDRLEDGFTAHWTGRPAPICMLASVGEEKYILCGVNSKNVQNIGHRHRIEQTDVTVSPLSTTYTFENDTVKAVVTFTTPSLLDKADILCRPVSFVSYDIVDKTGENRACKFTFGISSVICVDNGHEKVKFEKTKVSLKVGNVNQNAERAAKDASLVNRGYLHVCDTNAQAAKVDGLTRYAGNDGIISMEDEYVAYAESPYIVLERNERSGHITLGYEEDTPIVYFGEDLPAAYFKHFSSFEEMLEKTDREYDKIMAQCREFEKAFDKELEPYGNVYKDILTVAYRQAVGSHKYCYDKDGNVLFCSYECNSGGFISTLDVTYPSIPLFLKYNPELVLGMLRPIVKYAESDDWKFDFTPHDVGFYPIANGQTYGMVMERQMPVEEAGNMLITLAAVKKFGGGNEYFEAHGDTFKKWADYLVSCGYDPGEQLCTDDFGGHLDHNCNLSLKAILGIAAYGDLSGQQSYIENARELAKLWQKEALSSTGGTRLAFDKDGTWSTKYNIVWDSILGYRLFDDEVKKGEIEFYKTKMNKYGVPLDCRKDYTKIDWLMWSTCIYKDKEYFDAVCESIARFMSETIDRVPMADWYETTKPIRNEFQARTVVGGLWICLL